VSTHTPEDLVGALTRHLEAVTPPPADLAAVHRRARQRRRRRGTTAVVAVLAAAAVTVAGIVLVRPSGAPDTAPDTVPDFAVPGGFDYANGLRAYADPGGTLFLGGRALPADDLEYLDTDAVATSHGLVFFDRGRPTLLTEDGTTRALHEGRLESSGGFHPTAKADATSRHVAYAVRHNAEATLVVRDLVRDETVATRALDCSDDCNDVVIEAIDHDVVFVRTADGTFLWGLENDEWVRFAGAKTRVADVRNRVVLYDGPTPTLPLSAWTYVRGAIDAQLTLDGKHILYWSDTLEPVSAGDEPITLNVPGPGATFFSIDTDGSVLAATAGSPATFYDCEIPSGRCEKLGDVELTGGDPMFIGNDM